MYRFLAQKDPQYTATTLSVTPTEVLPFEGDMHQVVREYDDNSVSGTEISSNVYFEVPLRWNRIYPADWNTLTDFWFDPLKGNGRLRTFPWTHPIDGHIYTARFWTKVPSAFDPAGRLSVRPLILRVEGVLV